MVSRHNRRRRHRKHKRDAARRASNRLHRLRLGWPVSDDPVTMTELAHRADEERIIGLIDGFLSETLPELVYWMRT